VYYANMHKDFDAWNESKKNLDSRKHAPHCHAGEVWWCSIGVNIGSEQDSMSSEYGRPIVVLRKVSRNVFLAVPLTTKIRDGVPFRVRIEFQGAVSDALIDQVRVYDRRRLMRLIGKLDTGTFARIQDALTDLVGNTKSRARRDFSEPSNEGTV